MITSRQASFLDHALVWGLKVRIMEECPAVISGLTQRGIMLLSHQVQEWLLDVNTQVHVAFDGEAPVGLLVFRYGGLVSISDAAIHVPHLWVDPAHRGVASRMLLKRLADFVRRYGDLSVHVPVRQDYHHLAGMLSKSGFVPEMTIYSKEYLCHQP